MIHARALAALLLASAATLATAQTYPNKPVRMIIGFPAGGGSDVLYRKLAEPLRVRLGQPVVIENRPGAGAAIAAQAVVQSPADGYTLYGAGTSIAAFKIFNKDLTFDVQKNLVPITRVADTAYSIVINTKSPAKNLKEFVAWVKANPGKYNFGSPGGGVRLAMEMFLETTGMNMVHVQYKGEADYSTALFGDQVQLVFGSFSIYSANADKARIIAVSTGQRVSGVPDVPTVAESGYPSFVTGNWYGALAPAGTPRPIIQKLNADMVAVMNSEDVKQDISKWSQGTYFLTPSTPEEFAHFLDEEIKRLVGVAQRAKVES